MFDTEHDIYQHFASCIVKAIPNPNWETAYLTVAISGNATQQVCGYFTANNPKDFDYDIDDGADMDAQVMEAALSLRNIHRARENSDAFNKFKFTLHNDGTFNVEFKYDTDFKYAESLNGDSQEYSDLLAYNVIDSIESWEGLPKDHPRPWLH
ncbi:immunity protein YezG family protein [Saccharophagus degradans]|uniref:DUF600 family protein n=1 Tax=Saccharophagus degradans TaxID=86304 RepID=A0AAW7X7R3_9GAMM|nr:immunity protein YezG family protein [Saccharophagus degradans]MDO6422776.1 DUF600 family protein [Saccharophagus degradans]MDO6606249.1 DUF600 family protein [Saccharophagus degradans]